MADVLLVFAVRILANLQVFPVSPVVNQDLNFRQLEGMQNQRILNREFISLE